MPLPNESVTLTAAQVAELNKKLSTMRHEINNHLCLIVAAVELIRLKPERTAGMLESLIGQPPKTTAAMKKFSTEFEQALGITPGYSSPAPGAD